MFFSPEKQHFLNQKEVSSEQKERAIKYAQELKSLQAKESPTEGDKKRAEELAKRIKWIYSPEKGLKLESEKARELLQDLKHTALYDKEKKQWNLEMDRNGKLKYSDHTSESQLLGVLAEAVTGNLEGAKELLQPFKDTLLYDTEKKQWNKYLDEDEKLQYSERYSHHQLLGVLAEAATGNRKRARKLLQFLKSTPLYDKKNRLWNWKMNIGKKRVFDNLLRVSSTQLLGVLAEAIIGNVGEAKKMFQSLKKTLWYDEGKKQWRGLMLDETGRSIIPDSSCYSHNQLLGVLAEAVAGNLGRAKESLQSLKKTPLYDNKKKQWNLEVGKNGELVNSDRTSTDQLLGVLAEALTDKGEELVEYLTQVNPR